MTTFVKATYYPNERVAEYVTAEGKRLLRQGGSLCWLLNNCGNLVAPMRDGKPAPKKTRNYVGFARAGSAGHHFFMFSSYEAGREELKAWFKRRSQLSIQECIKAYAPSHENDTAKYIADLERMSGLLGSQVVGELSDTDMSKLVDALERKEGYHKDAHTRKERWVEATSISASNGSAPIAGLELQVQRGDKTETIKSNAQGQFPPIAHSGKSPVVVKAPKADGTWDKILELSESTASRFYQLVVDWFSTSATMQSDQAPSQVKQKRTPIQYRVQPGDSLSKIAKNFHTEVADLKRHNKLKNDTIYPEQVLWIYGAGAIDTGPQMPKPVLPKVGKPPAASSAKASVPVAKPTKAPAADTAPVVRGQQGEGKPLAVFTAEPGRAPWMAVALREAKQWVGANEKNIKDNYHDLSGSLNASLSTPWCASFVNYCLKDSGSQYERSASSQFPTSSAKFVKIEKPVYGALVVLKNYGADNGKAHGTGHVTFMYGFNNNGRIVALGGNQGNTIKFSLYKAFGESEAFNVGTKKLPIWVVQRFYGYYVPSAYLAFAENYELTDEPVDEADLNRLLLGIQLNRKPSSESTR